MDWVTAVWAALAGACLMLALIHLAVWFRNRNSRANLWFFITVCGVIGVMACELLAMHVENPAAFETAVRWAHVGYVFVFTGILGFVQSYFGTGRRWLFWLALGLRSVALVANFTTGSSLHFAAVHSLGKLWFLGELVAVPGRFDSNPWLLSGQLSSLALLVYVADASLGLWRSGTPGARRRALLLGGSLGGFALVAPVLPMLSMAGVLKIPMIASLPFLGMILAMNYELGGELLRAARISRDLETNRQRLALAATAAHMALWERDIATGRIWVSKDGRGLYGISEGYGNIDWQMFLATLHPEDRATVIRAMNDALHGTRPYAVEYRLKLPDGSTRWISGVGKVERDENGRAVLMRGVSMDITERKRTEARTEVQRQELARLSRVSMLGEMAGALAHELNQPLAAMLSNAQVGRRSLLAESPDLTEMAAIFDDIAADAKRAGGIIHGMRAMLKKDAPAGDSPLSLNDAVRQVVSLLHGEIINRKLEVALQLGDSLPPARANLVEVQQVLVNLVINGFDSMKSAPGVLTIFTTSADGMVTVSVHDAGPGIPPEILSRLFDPFFTTKAGGLGLGLSISRSIVERFGGELRAENHPDGGAVFHMALPAAL